MLCQSLNRITIELFAEIRAGMKSLTIEDLEKILRVEIRKQILWAHHVDEGTLSGLRKAEAIGPVN